MKSQSPLNLKPFQCQVNYSVYLVSISGFVYSLGSVFVLVSPLPLWLKVFALGFIAYAAWRSLRRQFLQTLRLEHNLEGWSVYPEGDEPSQQVINLDGKRCLLWPWLVVLYAPYGRTVLIPKDSVSDENFRRIHLRLRANPY